MKHDEMNEDEIWIKWDDWGIKISKILTIHSILKFNDSYDDYWKIWNSWELKRANRKPLEVYFCDNRKITFSTRWFLWSFSMTIVGDFCTLLPSTHRSFIFCNPLIFFLQNHLVLKTFSNDGIEIVTLRHQKGVKKIDFHLHTEKNGFFSLFVDHF